MLDDRSQFTEQATDETDAEGQITQRPLLPPAEGRIALPWNDTERIAVNQIHINPNMSIKSLLMIGIDIDLKCTTIIAVIAHHIEELWICLARGYYWYDIVAIGMSDVTGNDLWTTLNDL